MTHVALAALASMCVAAAAVVTHPPHGRTWPIVLVWSLLMLLLAAVPAKQSRWPAAVAIACASVGLAASLFMMGITLLFLGFAFNPGEAKANLIMFPGLTACHAWMLFGAFKAFKRAQPVPRET